MNNNKKNAMTDKLVLGAQAAAATIKAGGSFEDRLASVEGLHTRPASTEVTSMPVRRVPLDDILDRETDVRPINDQHVIELAQSISAVGLLQFPVVDESNRLLAGGHRREAVRLLRAVAQMPDEDIRKLFERGEAPDPLTDTDLARLREAYAREFAGGVVVRVFSTAGFNEAEIRLEVEAIENEKRLDFTREELAGIVTRLKDAGYRDVGGRPKEGQRVLSKELERIMGKSRRTVFRLLSELKDKKPTEEKATLSAAMKALAQQLTDELGTRVSFHVGDGQAGKIVVHYSSYKQRTELLKQMKLVK
jgi:ParB family chromosome partitioning protein